MREMVITNRGAALGYTLFTWRSSLSIARKLMLALGFACLTGLMAQVRFPLPWTPVPITGQTFAVFVCGMFLGRCWGGISQAFYIGLGVLGIPWFAGWSGGYGAIWGPTGGYLLGFIPAALLVGYFTDTRIRRGRFLSYLGLLLFVNFALIHVPGLLHLRLWYQLALHKPVTLMQLMMVGTVPFIAGDIIKILAVSGIASVISPRHPGLA